MSDKVEMSEIPNCDFCDDPAAYDGKTLAGPWAYMCATHWRMYGIGRLGTGYGQRLVLRQEASNGTQ